MVTIVVIAIVAAAVTLAVRLQGALRRSPPRPKSDWPVPVSEPEPEEQPVGKSRGTTQSMPHEAAAAAPAPVAPMAPHPSPPTRTSVGTGFYDGVRSWGYQLQKVSMKDVAASPFDLMVIDYSKDGSDAQAFTPGDIARMKAKPDGTHRHVIAYMSIGEAESYRYYWDPAWSERKPTWLLDENPDWKANYSVCYWDPSWQGQFCGNPSAYLDRIIAAGFDGVYLDKCDVFEDLEARNQKVAASRPDLEGDMVNFIARLSHYAKARKPTFTVIMQNAESLLEHEPLREAIDGVAKESLLYGQSGPEKPNPKDEITFARRALDLARAAGRTVFVVEYLSDGAKINEASATLDAWGFIATTSPKSRKLDHLNPAPPAA